jgi:hypothetical protein
LEGFRKLKIPQRMKKPEKSQVERTKLEGPTYPRALNITGMDPNLERKTEKAMAQRMGNPPSL